MAILSDLKTLLDIGAEDASEDAKLNLYISAAGQKILDRLYPFDDTQTTVPARYLSKQLEIAQYLYLKRGAEDKSLTTRTELIAHMKMLMFPNRLWRNCAILWITNESR